MKPNAFFLAATFFLGTFSLSAQNRTSDEPRLRNYCETYTTAQFFELSDANQKISFDNLDWPLLEAAVFHASNEARAKFKRPLFKFNLELCQAGASHLNDMKKNHYFDHENPKNKKATQMEVRYKRFIKGLSQMGENIAMNYVYPDEQSYAEVARIVIDQWLDSPGHRKNLLDPSFTILGTGVLNVNVLEQDESYAEMNYIQCFGRK